MTDTGPATIRNPDTRRETTDAPLWAIGLLAGIVAAGVALVVGGLLLLYPHATDDQPKAPTTSMRAPRLQTNPTADLADYRRAAQEALSTYGWANQAKGLARVPIEEAMRRVAAHGIPDWPQPGKDPSR